jgi:hypothetical protein
MAEHRRFMPTFTESPSFEKQAEALFSEEEREALINHLADDPAAGVLIPDTGGVRKLRWAAKGQGKRGGARVIYYYCNPDCPIFLFAAYGKNEKSDLSALEKKRLRSAVEFIRAKFNSGRNGV